MGENTSFVDYYELLEVPADAEPAEIRVSFVRLAKLHHPDAGGLTATMQQINSAYRTLMSPSSRKAYDLLHNFHTGTAISHYRDTDGPTRGYAADDLSDEEIDIFIDSIYSEYLNTPKQKKSLLSRIKQLF